MTRRSLRIRGGAFAAAALLSLVNAAAMAQQIQATVSGAVQIKSSSKKNIQASVVPAMENAAQAALRVFASRREFEGVVKKLGREDRARLNPVLLDDNVCQKFNIDHTFDKATSTVTWRFRFDCDQQLLLTEIQNLAGGGSSGSGTVSLANVVLTGLFYAQLDAEVTEYDADVERSRSDTAGVSSRMDASASLTTDDRVKAGMKSSDKEKVTYGETAGSISEGVNRTQSLEAREKTESSAQASASLDASTTVSQSTRSGGRSTRRSAEVTRRVIGAQTIERELGSILQQQEARFSEYGEVEVSCSGPASGKILAELQSLPPDMDLKLSAQTRKAAHDAARACNVQFFVEGYAKIGAPTTDPATGGIRVYVSVSQGVYDIRGPLATQVSITKEQQTYGTGIDETTARNNALSKASQLVANQTNQDLVARLSAQ